MKRTVPALILFASTRLLTACGPATEDEPLPAESAAMESQTQALYESCTDSGVSLAQPDEASELRSQLAGLYDREGARLYRYAAVILMDSSAAEDAVQQAFASLLGQRRTGVLAEPEAYLRLAVRNQCFSWLRRRGREEYVPDPAVFERPRDQGLAGETVMLERELHALPPEQREAVHLRVFEGCTFDEMAAQGSGVGRCSTGAARVGRDDDDAAGSG